MSTVTAGLIGVLMTVVLMAFGVPVGAGLVLVGILGSLYVVGLNPTLSMLGMLPYEKMLSYTLSAIPLFVLMGSIVFYSGIAARLYSTAHKWMGHLPGGLGAATVLACGGFAAVCGSSLATAAAMGNIAYPEMDRHGYSKSFAGGIIAAGGTLGIMIPPSVIFILYGIMTEQSIGRLFVAGVFPGILQIVFFIGTIMAVIKLRPGSATSVPRVPLKEMMRSLSGVIPIVVLFLAVLGGLYSGVFTATEAGAVGAFGAVIISIAGGWFSGKKMGASLVDTVRTTGLMTFILVGAMIFSFFLAVSKLPFAMADFAVASRLPPYGVLVFIMVIYMVLGCFMDSLAMVLLTIPIFTPVLFALGFDPILVGVLICFQVELALITPPFGMNVFVLKGVIKELPLEELYKGVIPFVLADILLLPLLIAFPQISLFLPNLMYK